MNTTTTTTTKRFSVFRLSGRNSRGEKSLSQNTNSLPEDTLLSKDQFLQILKDGDERFARGEYKTEEEMWALIDQLRVRVHEYYSK